MTSPSLQRPARRGKLTDSAKTFVVQQLAAFEAPADVRRALKADFGVEISDNAVRGYDPTSPKGAALSQRWRELFDHARRTYLEDITRVGISHKVHRLVRLDRMAARAEAQGNFAMAAQLLEQAAKEMGDAYTNTRVVKGALEVTAPKSLADFYGGLEAYPQIHEMPDKEGLN